VVKADMDFAVQKGTGGQHHGACADIETNLGSGPNYSVTLDQEVVDRLLKKPQIRLILEATPNRRAIKNAVSLSPRGAHRGAFARIQNPKLNARFVGGRRHGTAKRIDFFDQMPFTDAANRGIARHLAERLDIVGQQQRAAAGSGRGERGFSARVTAANDDDIKGFRMIHAIPEGWARRSETVGEYRRNCDQVVSRETPRIRFARGGTPVFKSGGGIS
jgi:hypothetical protein